MFSPDTYANLFIAWCIRGKVLDTSFKAFRYNSRIHGHELLSLEQINFKVFENLFATCFSSINFIMYLRSFSGNWLRSIGFRGSKMLGAQDIEPEDTSLSVADERIKQIDGLIKRKDLSSDNNLLFRLLDGFLEDPILLDPFLGDWCDRLSFELREALPKKSLHSLEHILMIYNHLCKVRGASFISTMH